MMKKSVLLSLVLFLGAIAAPLAAQSDFLPGLPGAQFFEAVDLERFPESLGVSEADVISEAYAVIQQSLRDSGHNVSIQVSGFQTFYSGDFGDILATDLWEIQAGLFIDVERQFLSVNSSAVGRHVHFGAKWSEHEPWEDSLESPLAAKTLAEMIQLAASEDHDYPKISAVTSYDVVLGFEGQERIYRAGVSWEVKEGEFQAVFRFKDVGIPRADDILATEDPITPHEALADLWEDEDPASFFDGGDTTESAGDDLPLRCYAETWDTRNNLISLSDPLGHRSGQHAARVRVAGLCSCNVRCLARCTPYFAFRDCTEFGSLSNVLLRHKRASDIEVAGGPGVADARCEGAQGCAVKSCVKLLPCSGVSFSFGGKAGGKITVTPTSAVLANMSISDTAICRCHVEGEEYPPDCDRNTGDELGGSHAFMSPMEWLVLN